MAAACDAPLQVLKSVFKKYDTDNSNTINATELKGLCYDLGYYLSDEETSATLKLLDKGTPFIDHYL
jgi:Ca2+-binding EF-hand superfamily protein